MQTKDADIDREIDGCAQKEPYILIVGAPGRDDQYFLVFEKKILFEEQDFLDSIILLFASYYNFNVVYVRPLHPILLFFQNYVFKIETTKTKEPQSLINFIQATHSL